MTRLDEEIAARLAAVRERVADAACRSGRDPARVRVIGVSKRQPVERVVAAARAGLRDFGENFVQEARAKIPQVRAQLDPVLAEGLRWHLVGRLQRNKAREALRWFGTVHSLDRAALADELDRRAAQAGRRLDVLIQVNLSREPQKGGVAESELPHLLEHMSRLEHLRPVGLMTVPAFDPDPEATRPVFARLREWLEKLRSAPGGAALTELSMGMTHDFEVAIEEGATWVRLGTAIFGPREGRV